jgi:excisionase family DNA binding protein
MAKISLISWRRREEKFPQTAAQRRARAREQKPDSADQCGIRADALEVLTAAPVFELPEFDEDHLMAEMDSLALLNSDRLDDASEETFEAPAEPCVSLDLTADQSRTLRRLSLFSAGSEENAPHALFQLNKLHDHRGMTLQFSLHMHVIPEMVSLKDVCRQLKVGRRTIMRLIRRRELRSYRVAHRYRFAVEDVKHYLDRIATY